MTPRLKFLRGRDVIILRWYEDSLCHDCQSQAKWVVFEIPMNGISYPNPIRWFWCGKCS